MLPIVILKAHILLNHYLSKTMERAFFFGFESVLYLYDIEALVKM